MIRCLLIAMVLATATPTSAQPTGPCAPGKAANEYKFWEYIANNASRTAGDYAMKRNPRAAFLGPDVQVVYQEAGEHVGYYLVKLLQRGSGGTSFAMLKPTFNFCADPSKLDDNREDLFKVVMAKFNGRLF